MGTAAMRMSPNRPSPWTAPPARTGRRRDRGKTGDPTMRKYSIFRSNPPHMTSTQLSTVTRVPAAWRSAIFAPVALKFAHDLDQTCEAERLSHRIEVGVAID